MAGGPFRGPLTAVALGSRFARQGYRATTIAQIEDALGSPGNRVRQQLSYGEEIGAED
jgi:hypothetical protein